MRVGSLFSGIGGFDLGLERAGCEIIWQVENDDYCRQVLKKHWPKVPCHYDIRTIDWRELPPVDLLCGGPPCQPFSCAGQRRGAADDRNLWPETLEAVAALRPRWILFENVPGVLAYLFESVLPALEGFGYSNTPWGEIIPVVIPACGVDAPQLRYRVWIVAYGSSNGMESESSPAKRKIQLANSDRRGTRSHVPNTELDALRLQPGRTESGRPDSSKSRHDGKNGPVAESKEQPKRTGLCASEQREQRGRRFGNGGSAGDIPNTYRQSLGRSAKPRNQYRKWPTEPQLGRVADGIPHRVDRLKGLGNAVVPQIVEALGRMIVEADQ